MADAFDEEDLFAVFEQQSPATEKGKSTKKDGKGKTKATTSCITPKAGLKRDFDTEENEPTWDPDDESAATKKQRVEDTIESLLESVPQVDVVTLDILEACSHEVAFPKGFEYTPLVQSAAKPAKEYPFILDPFQKEALRCLENNKSVLISAHTSAGKTVVAEYAIAMSLQKKQRVIYTTPIKALSNQKYRELYEEFQDVGLMTGDVTINPTASALVMTTEILRSMLYRGSEVMREVAWVVFDEIHYMRDKERGVVWEETIILLPDNVHYVFLSATIPNARQFAEWIVHLHKQPCHVVYTDFRPTPLQHYIYPAGGDGLFLVVDEKGDFREENFQKAMGVIRVGGGDPGAQRGRKGGTKGPSNTFKIVKMIMERNFQPVIIFSFSKKECEAYALQMSKLDFNTAQEKTLVEEVFNNAIDCLSDEDKKLPQVEHVLPLLKRGIGIHHSGLLPILKETIEILFSEGLIKALFATETFALGLNMPARTVVFSNARKFDGKDFRFITSGEYIQMSGRAGRRGLDERGIVILIIDEKMGPDVGKGLLKGHADPLNSAFHLTYNMVLNLLRVEEINPEIMLEKSFYQFQNYAAIPAMIEKMKDLESKRDQVEIPNEESITAYYKIRQQLKKLADDMLAFIHQPKYCLPFMQPGRLVRVQNNDEDFGWGAVLNFQKKANQKGAVGDTLYVLEVLLKCSPKAIKSADGDIPKPCGPDEKGEMQVVPVLMHLVKRISSVRLYIPKDLRSLDSRQSVGKSIQEVKKRFPDGLPLLDPIEDMGIKDDGLKKIVRKIEMLEHRMYTHPLHKDPELDKLYSLCEKKAMVSNEIRAARKELKRARTILQLDELKCRKRVLRRLGYATASDVIEVKGRVACELSSGDELLLTEMIFNGVFNELTTEQSVALLSCFICEERSDEMPKLREELAGPLRQMQESARRIAKVSQEAKMELDVEEYVEKFRPHIMDVVFAWANGSSFSQICKMTDIFEGSVIRCMRRLEELLRQMCQAAKAIGNTELENKFAEGIVKIKRDIVFAASLYL
ncbi:exosome RNA helicase MTR4 [Nematostella vectensis]|uniref:exosome RNA helicase MTR4 n=1 Tax=Nematostella vectensis TaxID=45351 RepID=UPI00207781B9|nr:exosome RNA helicase MTR4 [Nematostella vectensis]